MLWRDRKSKHSGGGIAIYSNEELNITRRTDLEDSDLEIIWMQVFPFKSKRSILIAGLYRPPAVNVDYDKKLGNNIENAYLLYLSLFYFH